MESAFTYNVGPTNQKTNYFTSSLVVNIIKQFLEEIWTFEIYPIAKTAKIGHFKSN